MGVTEGVTTSSATYDKRNAQHTSFKLRVIYKDARVDNITASPLTTRAIIDVGIIPRFLVGDSAQTPRSARVKEPVLCMHFCVLGYPFDLPSIKISH